MYNINTDYMRNHFTFFAIFFFYLPTSGTFKGNKNITTNIYRLEAYDSIICGYFSIGFNDFVLKSKCLLDY